MHGFTLPDKAARTRLWGQGRALLLERVVDCATAWQSQPPIPLRPRVAACGIMASLSAAASAHEAGRDTAGAQDSDTHAKRGCWSHIAGSEASTQQHEEVKHAAAQEPPAVRLDLVTAQ